MTEERFRVRDKDWATVWGEGMTRAEADRFKETVVGNGRSRTARVESMSVPPPDWYAAQHEEMVADGEPALSLLTDAQSEPAADPPAPLTYGIDRGGETFVVKSAGAVVHIPPGHALVVNDVMMPVPTTVAPGDRVEARAQDPVIIAAQARARAAVRPVMNKARIVLPDMTVRKPKPRAKPAPPDKTSSKAPPFVRLGAPPVAAPKPPPSPLKVALIPDGEPIPDDAIGEEDLSDLSLDLGGVESKDDVKHAERVRDQERSR